MDTDTTLRHLDAARDIPDDLVERPRARQTLATILEDSPVQAPASATRRGRTIARYAVAAAVVVAAGAAASELVGGSTAYASWTATARLANPTEQVQWGTDCVGRWTGHGYVVRLVEMRGRYAYTVLAGNDGYEATCLMQDNRAGHEVTGSGFEAPLKRSPTADGLVTNSVRAQGDDEGNGYFEVTGKAGADVRSIVIEGDGVDVTATLRDGYFAAWWPGRISLLPRFGPLNPKVTITLRDGTVRSAHIQDFDVSPM